MWYNTLAMKPSVLQSVVYKEGKYYVAQCLDVDVSSFGSTQEDALANLAEAAELYLEDDPKSKRAIHSIENPTIHSFRLNHA